MNDDEAKAAADKLAHFLESIARAVLVVAETQDHMLKSMEAMVLAQKRHHERMEKLLGFGEEKH